jgi:hypothetical protein
VAVWPSIPTRISLTVPGGVPSKRRIVSRVDNQALQVDKSPDSMAAVFVRISDAGIAGSDPTARVCVAPTIQWTVR